MAAYASHRKGVCICPIQPPLKASAATLGESQAKYTSSTRSSILTYNHKHSRRIQPVMTNGARGFPLLNEGFRLLLSTQRQRTDEKKSIIYRHSVTMKQQPTKRDCLVTLHEEEFSANWSFVGCCSTVDNQIAVVRLAPKAWLIGSTGRGYSRIQDPALRGHFELEQKHQRTGK